MSARLEKEPFFVYVRQLVRRSKLVNVQPPPPLHPSANLQEWNHFIQGTSGNDISVVTGKQVEARYVFRPFFKIATMKIYLIWTIFQVLIDIES